MYFKERVKLATARHRRSLIKPSIDRSRELAFKAWTDPQHVAKWWGPKGFTTTIHEIDVRPGGVWRFVMHGPDGVDYQNKIVFIEIAPPARLVYSHGDEDGKSEPFHVTVSFDEQGGKTALTMRALFPSVEAFEEVKKFGAIEGGNSSLDCLEEYLATM